MCTSHYIAIDLVEDNTEARVFIYVDRRHGKITGLVNYKCTNYVSYLIYSGLSAVDRYCSAYASRKHGL